MHYGPAIACRPLALCFQSRNIITVDLAHRRSSSTQGCFFFFSFFSVITKQPPPSRRHLAQNSTIRLPTPSKAHQWPPPTKSVRSHPLRQFSTSSPDRIQRFPYRQTQAQERNPPARAPSLLAFRRNDFDAKEVAMVFGGDATTKKAPPPPPPPSTRMANTLLKVLHSRRVNGTLDLDLPPKLTAQLKAHPNAVDDALRWLRLHHPIDEDAAIVRRIEREEAGDGIEEYINRAEDLGLYKPQSGSYEAPLGKEGDIFGESRLDTLRKENEARAEREKEELDGYIEQQMKVEEDKARSRSQALETRREDGLEVSSGPRPPNSFERWILQYRLGATSKLSLEEASKKGKLSRLLPSFLFGSAIIASCYLYARSWSPPDRDTRLMPSQPLSRATIFGIIGANVLIFLLWKFPPSWRLLNCGFISTPADIRLLSHVGNVFSHVKLDHIAVNMLLLYLLGEPLHEQVGRGWFLALYVASGVGGSVVSLTSFVARNVLVSSSLGASGAVSGVVAAFLTVNSERKMTSWLLPEQWTEHLSVDGSTLLSMIIAAELVSLSVPFLRSRTTDYAAHLGGYAVGILGGMLWRREHGGGNGGSAGTSPAQFRAAKWYDKFVGGG